MNGQKLMKESINKIIHHNYWHWGESYYIILDNGNGTITMQIDNDDKTLGYISSLSVTDSARNKGQGNDLLNACEELAKSLNIKELYLSAEKKSWVFKRYKRHGYIKYKYRNKYLYRLTKQL